MSEWRALTHTDEEHAMLFDQGRFIAGMWVYNTSPGTHSWEADIVSIDDERGESQQHTGWLLTDYTHWLPMSALAAPPQEPSDE
jgi:hypothetical protein